MQSSSVSVMQESDTLFASQVRKHCNLASSGKEGNVFDHQVLGPGEIFEIVNGEILQVGT